MFQMKETQDGLYCIYPTGCASNYTRNAYVLAFCSINEILAINSVPESQLIIPLFSGSLCPSTISINFQCQHKTLCHTTNNETILYG